MRIYEIAPGEKESVDIEQEKILELLTRDCDYALTAMRKVKLPLYRGYKGQQLNAFKGASRQNRNPLSFDLNTAQQLDHMYKHYGFSALRSNSIFCTTKYSEAEFYTSYVPGEGRPESRIQSNVYYIFPCDRFKFTWASKTSDLYGDWGRSDTDLLDREDYDAVLNKYGITNKNFVAALQSGHEININGTYYAFNIELYKHIIEPIIFS
jgi:hypothetical protein